MKKYFLLILSFCSLNNSSFSQLTNAKILFVIDSIPLLNDPEEWNQLLERDIYEIRVVNNKDSLKFLGFSNFDGVTYIFTKEYHNRPYRLRIIPSLKQMEFKDGVWNFLGVPYNGKYIDYFNSGKKLNEGSLRNGKQNGELKIYFENGALFKQGFFANGKNTGNEISYYKTGIISGKINYADGRSFRSEHYYPNGQLESGNLNQSFNTAITYFSTGKIKKLILLKNGTAITDATDDAINKFMISVHQSIREGDFKNGLKWCNKIIELDSLNESAYFYKGEFLSQQNQFDNAISAYDKAIKIEALLGYVLIKRAFVRIKKYESLNYGVSASANHKVIIPATEIEKICTDLQQAIYCGANEKRINEAISKYCEKK